MTDHLHLTLRFLGATPEARVDAVRDAVVAAARTASPFTVRLGGAGAFPSASRPRVAWLGIADGAPELAALAGGISRELAARAWPADDRPYRAHLTLGRADGVAAAARIVDALVRAASDLDAAWTADRVIVYQSVLGHGPARYRPLADVELGDDAGDLEPGGGPATGGGFGAPNGGAAGGESLG